MKESCWLASWLARSLLTGCDRCHLSTMKRPEGSPHQSRWCQMLELKHCTQTHTRPCTNINHTRINNICRTVLLLFTMKSYLYTIHEQNHIYLLLLHKIQGSKKQRTLTWPSSYHHKQRKEDLPPSLMNLCRQKGKSAHRMSNYSNNFTCLCTP